MAKLHQKLAPYMLKTLGISLSASPWEQARRLPYYLQDRYTFFESVILDMPCLLMVDRSENAASPTGIRKNLDQVQLESGKAVLYVRDSVTDNIRQRLILQRVPFIVPGNQMYLPMLGIDLREHFRKIRDKRPHFRPATQVVLLDMLLGSDRYNAAELAKKLGYSAMTIGRAMDEIELAKLAQATPVGRERPLRLSKPKFDIWQQAQSFLTSPVRETRWISQGSSQDVSRPLAGLSALSQCSMLASPKHLTVAAHSKNRKTLLQKNVKESLPGEPDALCIEVWRYSPTLFARENRVDPLSLYLSLRENNDERVQAALERMIGELTW